MLIDLRCALFRSEEDRERSERAMHYILHALCCVDYEYLLAHPETPSVYASGVRYQRPGKPEWFDVPTALSARYADCKDLACWLVAEHWLRRQMRSRPLIRYRLARLPNGKMFSLYHVLVQRPDGSQEDPSAALGMGGADGMAA